MNAEPVQSCRLLTADDVAPLLTSLDAIKPDPYVHAQTERILWETVDRTREDSLTSFSRFVQFGTTHGHLSANLITNEAADDIECPRSKRALYDADLSRPINREALQSANRGEGSTLFITTLIWNEPGSKIERLLFCKLAIDHLARWFEGNRIQSVMFSAWDSYDFIVRPILSSLDAEAYRTFLVEPRIQSVRIFAPWRPATVFDAWLHQLFKEYPDPEVSLSDCLKFKGRILHEFMFDVGEAVRSCIPTWSPPADFNKMACAAFDGWRKEAGFDLEVNRSRSKGTDTKEKIKALLKHNPRILTLY